MENRDAGFAVFSLAFLALFWAIFAIVVLIKTINRYVYDNAKKAVMEDSVALQQVIALSNNYCFYHIQGTHVYVKNQTSLAAFRRINYEYELLQFVESHQSLLMDEIRKIEINKQLYDQYIKKFENICETQKINWNTKRKEQIELQLIEENRLNPIRYIKIVIENVYTSPQGVSRYYDCRTFFKNDILKACSELKARETFEFQKKRERSKMSDSLRYDIFKRDGFRCTICGATAQEGAKLHVDHIVPVSRGGQTIKSNLRTLCSRCNLGKRDKYDPYGTN